MWSQPGASRGSCVNSFYQESCISDNRLTRGEHLEPVSLEPVLVQHLGEAHRGHGHPPLAPAPHLGDHQGDALHGGARLAVLLQGGQQAARLCDRQSVRGPGAKPQHHPLALQVEGHVLPVHNAHRERHGLPPCGHQLPLEHGVELLVELLVGVLLAVAEAPGPVLGADRAPDPRPSQRLVPEPPVVKVEHTEGPGEDDRGEHHRDPHNHAEDEEAPLVILLLFLCPVDVDVPVAEDAAASAQVGRLSGCCACCCRSWRCFVCSCDWHF